MATPAALTWMGEREEDKGWMSEGRAADVHRRLHGPSAGPGPGATVNEEKDSRRGYSSPAPSGATAPSGWGKATDATPTAWGERGAERGWMSEGSSANVRRRVLSLSAGSGPGATVIEDSRRNATAPFGWGEEKDATPTARRGPVGRGLGLGEREEDRGGMSEEQVADMHRRLHGLSAGPRPGGATVYENSSRSATAPSGWGEATPTGLGLGLGLRLGSGSASRPPLWTTPRAAASGGVTGGGTPEARTVVAAFGGGGFRGSEKRHPTRRDEEEEGEEEEELAVDAPPPLPPPRRASRTPPPVPHYVAAEVGRH